MMSLAGNPARSVSRFVGAPANFDAPRERVGLAALVERHHDRRRAVTPNESRLSAEIPPRPP